MIRRSLNIALIFAVALVVIGFGVYVAWGRDLDGRHANDPLHEWFNQLASGKGLCCSFADGFSVQDVDWDTGSNGDIGGEGNAHYRVRLHGQWIEVPDNAIVTEPNRFGPAVVWPYTDSDGTTKIRCFLPGAGA